METLTLEAARSVDAGALAAEVRGDAALVNVCGESGHGPGLHICKHPGVHRSPKLLNPGYKKRKTSNESFLFLPLFS